MARRVERSLLSYERSGWLEDTTVVTKHSEIRPSSEMGPIICCLDTSGSMHGARETIAKVFCTPFSTDVSAIRNWILFVSEKVELHRMSPNSTEA